MGEPTLAWSAQATTYTDTSQNSNTQEVFYYRGGFLAEA